MVELARVIDVVFYELSFIFKIYMVEEDLYLLVVCLFL